MLHLLIQTFRMKIPRPDKVARNKQTNKRKLIKDRACSYNYSMNDYTPIIPVIIQYG